jgi:hypothetical protein
MSYTAPSSPGEAHATRERLTRIQPGMEVKDAAGARIGTVAYVEIGDPGAVTPGGGESALPGEEIDLAMGAHPEPHVPPQMVGRLLLIGYIKVNDTRRFRPDRHFYAPADEIDAIEDNTVRLGKLRDELITSSR